MVNWTDKCHVCGANIFNGIPEGEDITTYIAKKKEEGWVIGYREKPIGRYGEVSIKPICKDCSQKESIASNIKKTKKAMREISKIIKKEFSCPCCEYLLRRGYIVKVFKTTNKQEMMTHIEKHGLEEIKEILPYKVDD